MSDASPLEWTEDGRPRSRLYGDIYFSLEDGLEETRTVFLKGCGLPEAWTGRSHFVVGELGFGSGLNILALLDLWRRTRDPGARLHVFSIEAHPMSGDDARRALSPWPEIADLAQLLVARWPGRARGFHRVDFPEVGATLDLAIMDVEAALGAWSGFADAWFLDGFSPALNPQMWREEVLSAVAARAAPGCRAATFTVAGAVRRGLQGAGFTIEKQPGFGRKRERLEARLPGLQPAARRPRVAVVGGGIAGASMARALRAMGAEPLLVSDGGEGASGNPAALVTPRLDAGLGPVARLFAQSLARARTLYASIPEAILASGVRQLTAGHRDVDRFARIAAADLYEPGEMRADSAGLDMGGALVVEPRTILESWRGETCIAQVDRLEHADGGWRLLDPAGAMIAEADAVVLACSQDAARLAPELSLSPVRGQATWVEGVSGPALAWGGYIAPTRTGLLFGATHDRGDTGAEVREADHARNLQTLAAALPDLAAQAAQRPLHGRAGTRATTQDRLPIAGALSASGLFALTGLGSRGFAAAPLLAEHVAALVLGAPSPLPKDLAAIVDPGRFAAREARRGAANAPRGPA